MDVSPAVLHVGHGPVTVEIYAFRVVVTLAAVLATAAVVCWAVETVSAVRSTGAVADDGDRSTGRRR